MKNVYHTDTHSISIYDGGVLEQRQHLLTKLSKKRKRVENQGAVYQDYIIKTDEGSLAKITSTIMSLQSGLVETVNWKASNGWIKNCDINDMMAIAMSVTHHVEKAFTVESDITSLLEAMSEEELATFDLDATWDSFYESTGL